MEYTDREYGLEVWGDIACFTRPELKVERVSYDVITPSAARAIFEAIFWKPAIRWQVTKIEVLNPIQWTSVRRNEVGAMAGKTPISINDPKNRQQKNTLMLKNVHYRIWAKLVFIPQWQRKETKNPLIDNEEKELLRKDENPMKYYQMFERRASNGQCFTQPYFGTRECAASFKLVDNSEDLKPALSAENGGNRELGIMLYDMEFSKNKNNPAAMFYRAEMKNGVIEVPSLDNKEVLR